MKVNTQTTHRPAQKKIYEKPELKSFSLMADEVMAGNCKLASGSTGPDGSQCSTGNCVTAGS